MSALYWLGRRGMDSKNGSRWLAAIRNRAPEDRLAQAQEKLGEHGVAVLVLSRLVPAGRIPVMLACLMAKWPLRRFARGDVPACLAWAATYQLIGVLGGSLFDEPWQGVVAAVVLTADDQRGARCVAAGARDARGDLNIGSSPPPPLPVPSLGLAPTRLSRLQAGG